MKNDLTEINIGSKCFYAKKILHCDEIAWHMKDVLEILFCFSKEKRIILGGDILDSQLIPNRDSWFYNFDEQKTYELNVQHSY